MPARGTNFFTKERDPELFKSYMKEYFADAQMGISADAVVRLYGDKLPSREDGILGWVPGIEESLKLRRPLARTFTFRWRIGSPMSIRNWRAN